MFRARILSADAGEVKKRAIITDILKCSYRPWDAQCIYHESQDGDWEFADVIDKNLTLAVIKYFKNLITKSKRNVTHDIFCDRLPDFPRDAKASGTFFLDPKSALTAGNEASLIIKAKILLSALVDNNSLPKFIWDDCLTNQFIKDYITKEVLDSKSAYKKHMLELIFNDDASEHPLYQYFQKTPTRHPQLAALELFYKNASLGFIPSKDKEASNLGRFHAAYKAALIEAPKTDAAENAANLL